MARALLSRRRLLGHFRRSVSSWIFRLNIVIETECNTLGVNQTIKIRIEETEEGWKEMKRVWVVARCRYLLSSSLCCDWLISHTETDNNECNHSDRAEWYAAWKKFLENWTNFVWKEKRKTHQKSESPWRLEKWAFKSAVHSASLTNRINNFILQIFNAICHTVIADFNSNRTCTTERVQFAALWKINMSRRTWFNLLAYYLHIGSISISVSPSDLDPAKFIRLKHDLLDIK